MEICEYPRPYNDIPPPPHYYFVSDGIESEFIYMPLNGTQIIRRYLRRSGNLSFPKGRIDNPTDIYAI